MMFDISDSNYNGQVLCKDCYLNCGPVNPEDKDYLLCGRLGMVKNVGVCPHYYPKKENKE